MTQQAASPRYGNVLVVEDETAFRQIIARNLARRGVYVREAGTAAEASRAAVADRPDLMLLDLNLPDRTGWDLLRSLRARGIDVPTLVISAVSVSQARLTEFQPVAYLPKPFPLDALLRLVIEPQATAPAEESGDAATSRRRSAGFHRQA